MLAISKPIFAGQAQSYHQKEFTAKEQNDWSQRGVIAGEWQGRLSAQFGLAGMVSAEDFAKLSQGQLHRPASSARLGLGCLRFSTVSCCWSARFFRSSSWRGRKQQTSAPKKAEMGNSHSRWVG